MRRWRSRILRKCCAGCATWNKRFPRQIMWMQQNTNAVWRHAAVAVSGAITYVFRPFVQSLSVRVSKVQSTRTDERNTVPPAPPMGHLMTANFISCKCFVVPRMDSGASREHSSPQGQAQAIGHAARRICSQQGFRGTPFTPPRSGSTARELAHPASENRLHTSGPLCCFMN